MATLFLIAKSISSPKKLLQSTHKKIHSKDIIMQSKKLLMGVERKNLLRNYFADEKLEIFLHKLTWMEIFVRVG